MIDNNTEIYHRLNNAPKGYALYEVRDEQTHKYKKYTVPEENADRFEKFIDGLNDSTFKNITERGFIRKVQIAGGAGAFLGAGISLLFTRNSKVMKKVLGGIGGALLGSFAVVCGFFVNIANKLGNLASQSKDLGIQPYKESEKSVNETDKTVEKSDDKPKDADNISQKTDEQPSEKSTK